MKFIGLILAITLSLVLALGVSPSLQADNMLAQADSDNATVQRGGGGGGSDNATVELKVEVVPPRRGGGGGGGAVIYYIDTDLFGVADRYRISYSGELHETIEATSADGMLAITVPEDTVALDKDGKRLKSLLVAIDESPPSPPKDARIIGLAYDFELEAATFAPPLTLTWSYDPALPEGIDEENLVVAYYDEDSSKWIELDCIVDTETNTITAPVGHFTTFALIGTVRLPPPAAFAVTDLSILPAEVYVGHSLSITVIATNTGGQSGSCEVTLRIDDVMEATKEVAVSPGLSKKVSFTISKDIPGIYSVDVDGLTSLFTVKAKAVPPVLPPAKPFPWPLVGGILAGGLIVGFLIFFLARRRVA